MDFHWGHITLIDSYLAPAYLRDGEGNLYVTDTHGGPRMWRLRCDCGHEWEIERLRFPGKRALRSCGRPECTALHKPAPEPKPKPVREPRGVIVGSVPQSLIDQVRTFQADKQLSLSRAMELLLHEGLISMLLKDEP